MWSNRITVEIAKLGAKCEGTLSKDGKRISGTFNRMGNSLPPELERAEKAPALTRA